MHATKEPLEPIIVKAGHVNWTTSKPSRSGIILYDKKGLYLGVDNNSKDLTDLGGEIHYIYEDAILGAIREYEEESLKCLPKLNWLQLYSSYVILGNSIVIFLVKIDQDKKIEDYIEAFRNIKKTKRYLEISDIVYVPIEQVKNTKIYKRIKPLLDHAIDHYLWD